MVQQGYAESAGYAQYGLLLMRLVRVAKDTAQTRANLCPSCHDL